MIPVCSSAAIGAPLDMSHSCRKQDFEKTPKAPTCGTAENGDGVSIDMSMTDHTQPKTGVISVDGTQSQAAARTPAAAPTACVQTMQRSQSAEPTTAGGADAKSKRMKETRTATGIEASGTARKSRAPVSKSETKEAKDANAKAMKTKKTKEMKTMKTQKTRKSHTKNFQPAKTQKSKGSTDDGKNKTESVETADAVIG